MWRISKKQTKFVIVWGGGGGIQNLGGEISRPKGPEKKNKKKKNTGQGLLIINILGIQKLPTRDSANEILHLFKHLHVHGKRLYWRTSRIIMKLYIVTNQIWQLLQNVYMPKFFEVCGLRIYQSRIYLFKNKFVSLSWRIWVIRTNTAWNRWYRNLLPDTALSWTAIAPCLCFLASKILIYAGSILDNHMKI